MTYKWNHHHDLKNYRMQNYFHFFCSDGFYTYSMKQIFCLPISLQFSMPLILIYNFVFVFIVLSLKQPFNLYDQLFVECDSYSTLLIH